MGNGLYRINWPGIHFDRRIEVHPTVLGDVTTPASDSEAHAVEHAEVGERSDPKRYNGVRSGSVRYILSDMSLDPSADHTGTEPETFGP